ncbi:hypothetical protein DH2020_044726 [Rehmannia glutinosa]|uniref:Reverse transcriptase Ty1/copia-type domain-containing protein n=1 Tax=Rehmannia glutinosa TaxID=99300 RepID=A0ABR0UG67_REHGL
MAGGCQDDLSNGHLDEEIYMQQPEGFVTEGQEQKICKLLRSIYGLKQASRSWNHRFDEMIKSYGFDQSVDELCVYKRIKDGRVAFLGFGGLQTAQVPLPAGVKLLANSGPLLTDPEKYRRLVGRLLYLNFTRPDITYSVQQLSQFVTSPCTDHWEAALHLVKYLKGTPSLGLFYSSSSPFTLYRLRRLGGSCPDTRKSLTGYCLFLGTSLVSWKTKKQNTVSRSSAEAEYRALGTTVCEMQWLSYIAADLHIPLPTPIPLWCDNKAALHIVENPVFHERTKHLDIDCHLVRNHFKSGFILPRHVSSSQQLADLFTKSLPAASFKALVFKLGLLDHHCPT